MLLDLELVFVECNVGVGVGIRCRCIGVAFIECVDDGVRHRLKGGVGRCLGTVWESDLGVISQVMG